MGLGKTKKGNRTGSRKIYRSSYYYKVVEPVLETDLEMKVKKIFLENKARFGARKIKQVLKKPKRFQLSRRQIRRIMKRLNLVCVSQK